MELDSSFEQKNEIAKAVEEELEKVFPFSSFMCLEHVHSRVIHSKPLTFYLLQAMSAYGYEIVQTLIVDIEPDVQVKRAMNEINAGMLSG